MKILKIHIYNLASLEGEVIIDFTMPPLSTAGIFAITGPTGAGKSTILDALCLALYARTPRYMQAREAGVFVKDAQGSTLAQSDPRGILRDGSGEGGAAVTFIGVDKETYQASWQVRRAKSKPDGNLMKHTIHLKNLRTGEAFPGTRTVLQQEIERLVGLNFEQFTRSVLLAQGDFTAFLKAGRDEKSALLEKLTGTQIYSEISLNIFNHFRAEENILNDLRSRHSAVNLLKEPVIKEIENIIRQTDNSIREIDSKLAICQKDLSWYGRATELHDLVESARQTYQTALEKKQGIGQRQEKLHLVEAVQPTRTWVDQWKAQQEILDTKKVQNKTLTAELITLKENQTNNQQRLDYLQKKAAAITQEKVLLKPKIENAKALDVQLQEKAKTVDRYKTHLVVLSNKQKEQEDQRTELQKKIESLQQESDQTKDWLAKNEIRQNIAGQVQLILSKLQDAKQSLSDEQYHSIAIEKLKIKEAEIKSALLGQQEHIQEINQQAEQIRSELTVLEAATNHESIEILEETQTATAQSVKELMQATSHWKQLQDWRRILQRNKEKLIKQQKQQTKNAAQLQLLDQTVAQTSLLKNAARENLDKARLVAAESVANLRAQLVIGEPCPVCGSKEHPFTKHDPTSEMILSVLEGNLRALDSKYNEALNQQNQLIADNKYITAELAELVPAISSDELALEQEEIIWRKFSFYGQIKTLEDEEISSYLTQQLSKQQKKEKAIGIKIKDLRNAKSNLETKNKTIQLLQTELAKSHMSEATLLSDLRSLRLAMDHDQSQIRHALNKLNQLKEEIGQYFPNENWYENWREKPGPFQTSITDFAEQWSKKLQQSSDQIAELKLLKEKSADLSQLITEQGINLMEWQKQTGTAEADYANCQQKRLELFDGAAVNDIEQQMETIWKEVSLQQEELQKEMAALEMEIARCSIQIKSLEQDTELSHKRLTEFSQLLDQWIIEYNQNNPQLLKVLTRQDLMELLTMSQEWIQSEKEIISQINQHVDISAGTLENRKYDFQQHQNKKTTEIELVTLQAEEQTLKKQLDELTRQKTEQLTRLKIDQEQKKKLAKLLDQIETQEKVFENWAKLNALIGSADGKKFRQIAQEYTLDALLKYANYHLKTLSKRYLLQRISGTLALQILDQDMGNEVRTVYSLSGGESFLVSLSLALGLASLSSNRLRVESLFIDEGFGSLDAATLNIAMDALERLHDQGRKVGIISHVQELTERIAVQIMVSKQPSGKSSIEIASI